MHPKTPKLLDDIRDAGAFIQEVTGSLTSASFRDDRLVRQAVASLASGCLGGDGLAL